MTEYLRLANGDRFPLTERDGERGVYAVLELPCLECQFAPDPECEGCGGSGRRTDEFFEPLAGLDDQVEAA